MTPSDLPEAVLRFEPQAWTNAKGERSLAGLGAVGRCVVVIDGRDVAVLQVANLRYDQEGAMPGHWSVELLADAERPLQRTMRVGR